MNPIQTETKGIRPIAYNGGNELAYYTYLKDVKYQVRAHFEPNNNQPKLKEDSRNENKHHNIAKRMVQRGGRRDIFLGTRECQAFVEPCVFGEGESYYDTMPGEVSYGFMYHGITYAEKFGKEGAFITKCTSQLMRDLGCAQSPQSAFILNLGLESLHVRMPRHVENGQAVAEFLEKHDKVEFVNYPTLPSNKYYEIAKKYLPNGGCGVVSFELKGGREAAEKFMKNLKLAAIETHVADARTCCLNPATSTHRQMTDEQLITAGIPAGLIRISCGLEDKNDLIADISQALDAI